MSAAPVDGAVVPPTGEWHVTGDPEATLLCIGRGSCVSLSLHDPTARMSGMAHMVLSDGWPRRRRHGGATFVDLAVPMLAETMLATGAVRSARAELVGGGAVLAATDTFPQADVGPHNVTGGCRVRTVRLHVGTSRVQATTAHGEIRRDWQRGELRPRGSVVRGSERSGNHPDRR